MAEADGDYEKNDISANKKSGAFFAQKTKKCAHFYEQHRSVFLYKFGIFGLF